MKLNQSFKTPKENTLLGTNVTYFSGETLFSPLILELLQTYLRCLEGLSFSFSHATVIFLTMFCLLFAFHISYTFVDVNFSIIKKNNWETFIYIIYIYKYIEENI